MMHTRFESQQVKLALSTRRPLWNKSLLISCALPVAWLPVFASPIIAELSIGQAAVAQAPTGQAPAGQAPAGPAMTGQVHPRTESATAQWLSFPDCPVLLENSVEVPAQETGLLEKFDVEVNATVTAGQTLARLDEELARMELKIARLQHTAAEEVAADDSQVQFRKLALKATEEELESHKTISKSVAGSELRRLNLSVGSATVEVQTAERAIKRAKVQAELSAATVQAATLRLDRRRIVAPLDGIVTAIHLRPGQWVEAGKPVLVISNLEQLLVDCLIPIDKVDLKRIVGLDVRVESERLSPGGRPVRLAGKITSYDPQVSSQGLVRVHSRIQNAREGGHWILLPGMSVKLEVAVAGESPALISRQPNHATSGK